MQERLIALFRERFGAKPQAILSLPGDGSSRTYRRLVGPDGRTAIGAVGPDRDENRAYLSFSRAFRNAGFPVPEILAADEDAGVWLAEDLGDTTLFDALEEGRDAAGGTFPERIIPVYRRAVEWLPRFQVEGDRLVDYSVSYPRAAFDRQSILWDLNYFKYHFLKLAHVPFNESRLEDDFGRLADFLLEADGNYFMYRDFQSRNIMLRRREPWFIDYQGGRRGALPYDIASLLYDAKADLPERVRDSLLTRYLDALEPLLRKGADGGEGGPGLAGEGGPRRAPERGPRHGGEGHLDRDRFEELYRGYVLVRILQALGAYGYRGFFERKRHFLRSVPYAARNLDRLLDNGLPVSLPELETVLRHIVSEWAAAGPDAGAGPDAAAGGREEVEADAEAHADALAGSDAADGAGAPGPDVAGGSDAADGAYAARGSDAGDGIGAGGGLTVEIFSFSFRRGYPEDSGGHGGGFVFDCRALPNPGRLEAYRTLSGRDREVADFIEAQAELEAYWNHVRGLVDAQVEAYRERDFTSLTISFGCTGGQHRSVYLAERLGRHLREHHPGVRVRVQHREQPSWACGGTDGKRLAWTP